MPQRKKHLTVEARKQAQRESARRFYAADPERAKAQQRAWHYKTKYGVTIEQRDALLEAQQGRCAICRRGIAFTGKGYQTAHLDHDHASGQIRGVLCGRCNTALGALGDTVEALRRVLAYLETTNAAA